MHIDTPTSEAISHSLSYLSADLCRALMLHAYRYTQVYSYLLIYLVSRSYLFTHLGRARQRCMRIDTLKSKAIYLSYIYLVSIYAPLPCATMLLAPQRARPPRAAPLEETPAFWPRAPRLTQ